MPNYREPATTTRRKRFGYANQMAHEASENVERSRTRAFLERGRSERKAEAAKGARSPARQKSLERGTNAGTMGGSHGRMRAFMGR